MWCPPRWMPCAIHIFEHSMPVFCDWTVSRPPPLQFVLMGPRPLDVMRQLTALVGRPALPPYWALGFHQGRCATCTAKGSVLGGVGIKCVVARAAALLGPRLPPGQVGLRCLNVDCRF